MEENPFPDLRIDQTDFLDNLAGRSKCQKCGKSRKYYCYTCYVPVQEIVDRVPKIKVGCVCHCCLRGMGPSSGGINLAFSLLPPFSMVSTLQGKNLLLQEQILFFQI